LPFADSPIRFLFSFKESSGVSNPDAASPHPKSETQDVLGMFSSCYKKRMVGSFSG
jgi:hypothetical protein